MIRTFNYIAAILVVFFGLWLFSGSNRQYLPATTVNDVADATSEIQSVSEPHYRNALSREMPMDFPDSQDVAHQSSAAVNSSRFAAGSDQESAGALQLPAEKAGRIVVAENNPVTDAVSDASWFSGLVNRAREIGDRIINIEISGSTDKGVAGESADIAASSDELSEEDSLLPQPTESETVAENKVNCPSMMYMSGNAYGRNMLITMGCPVP